MSTVPTPVEVFCSYAHEDEVWLRKLEVHLSLLKRQELLFLWYDRLLVPGSDWSQVIDTHLETASVILLLVSADFFASDYCYGVEMKRALARQEAGEVQVIPILLRPADWEASPFAHLHALPTNAKPITTWPNEDTALADVAAGIRRVLGELPLLAASAPRTALPAIWNIPYPRNPFFLGRDAELAHLRRFLQAGQGTALSQPQAISGLGGIGKTQLALEYAYRFHLDYRAVLWVRAESTETLISSYVAIASLLRLPEHEAKEQEVTVQAVRRWLQTHRDWLLILDNADELALLPAFLPPVLGGHLFLTTRASALGRLASCIEVEALPPEQGALFLLWRAALLAPDATLPQASPRDCELAMQISQELGGLPLALDQAGAYMEETQCSLADYQKLYGKHKVRLLKDRRGLVKDHPESVATTWALSFQKVEQKSPAAADLLRLCAFLAPDAIPEELVSEGAPDLGPRLSPIATDAFALNEAIEVLRHYSLIRRNRETSTLTVHRLVQAVLKDSLSKKTQWTWAARVVRVVNHLFPDPWFEVWPQCERLLSQVQASAELIEEYELVRAEAAALLHKGGWYLRDRARYRQAESLLQRALRINEQVYGPEHPHTAKTMYTLARLYLEQGKYEQAEPLYQRALHIAEQMHVLDLIAGTLKGLANLYSFQGKYEQAEPLYQRALHIREQALGPKHLDTVAALYSLARLYAEQGKYEQAEPLYQRALHSAEQTLGSENFLAATLGGLAVLYLKQSKYEQAEPLLKQALVIYEQQLGPLHPNLAHALNNLAGLYSFQGKYEQAEPLYQRALSIWEQQLGPLHPEVAHPLTGLAELYREQGKYAQAEPLYQRALHIREQRLGPEHPEAAETIHDLAVFQEAQGHQQEALSLYRRALVIREHALGPQHPNTRDTRQRFTVLSQMLERDDTAPLLERSHSEQGEQT